MDSSWSIKPEDGIGTIKALVSRVQQVKAMLEPEPVNVTAHIQAESLQSSHLPGYGIRPESEVPLIKTLCAREKHRGSSHLWASICPAVLLSTLGSQQRRVQLVMEGLLRSSQPEGISGLGCSSLYEGRETQESGQENQTDVLWVANMVVQEMFSSPPISNPACIPALLEKHNTQFQTLVYRESICQMQS